jgi:predicted amidophosphoribosyltransferase
MSDLINRQAAIDVVNAICERCGKYKEYNGVMCGACALDGVEDSIEDLPSAEPVRHGKWKMKPDPFGFFDEIPVCSECGCTTTMRDKPLYCPNCGADMRGTKCKGYTIARMDAE